MKIFDYVVICFVVDNGWHIAYAGLVLHKDSYEERWR
jgi:hypothetical protein